MELEALEKTVLSHALYQEENAEHNGSSEDKEARLAAIVSLRKKLGLEEAPVESTDLLKKLDNETTGELSQNKQ
jgi:hypothetical protein